MLWYVVCISAVLFLFFFFKQKTAYEMRISDWSSDVCSSDLTLPLPIPTVARQTPNHVHNQENHRNRCAGHEREVAPRMRRLGVVAVLELVHHCGGSFATTPSGVTLCNTSYPRSLAR